MMKGLFSYAIYRIILQVCLGEEKYINTQFWTAAAASNIHNPYLLSPFALLEWQLQIGIIGVIVKVATTTKFRSIYYTLLLESA